MKLGFDEHFELDLKPPFYQLWPVKRRNPSERPVFPKRAVVTAGMPYGNKDLHFGHIGAVFVQADFFARFLRDRIGSDNVLFVSGTDCYGSPIVESWTNATKNGSFSGSLEAFVSHYHELQRECLDLFRISLDYYGASGLGSSKPIHEKISNDIFQKLRDNGRLIKVEVPQFYDESAKVLLNGRQVIGRCPIQGCPSDKAYADECSLGHQYLPTDLIQPISTLSGERPTIRNVPNWCIKLEDFRKDLREWVEHMKSQPGHRDFVSKVITEFLSEPIIHVLKTFEDKLQTLKEELPKHEMLDDGEKARSFRLVFSSLSDRNRACEVLSRAEVRYRTSKYLVPFRLTGNVEWGVPVQGESHDGKNLTFWVWPESLWAPMSFTASYEAQVNGDAERWRDWWLSRDTSVYQYIGEDNIYFYGIGQFAIFAGLQNGTPVLPPKDGELQLTNLIASKHLLFLDKKASSSSDIKPPMARELLSHYTSDQLRAHFLGLGMGKKSISFKPRPFDPNAKANDADPVLKEGNLLSNVLNKAARSCLYTLQKFFDGLLPVGDVSPEVQSRCEEAVLDFESNVFKNQFYIAMNTADTFFREITKKWNRDMKTAEANSDEALRKQTLIDCFHMVKVAMVLMHPVAPDGTEMFHRYLRVGDDFWSWDKILEPIYSFMKDPSAHRFEFLEPRVDFFPKHESQFPKKS